MKVALVHSFYRSDLPSGENVVVLRQVDALRNAGHDVELVARHTDDQIALRSYPLRSAITVATGRGPDPTADLLDFAPDVVHVHNLFPNFGSRWLARWKGPLVATLHNFRPMCSNGLLFRDGRVCTDCIAGNPLNSVRHACYQGSRLATLPLALQNRGGLARNPLLQRADRVIVLSERSRRIFAEAGGSGLAGKLTVIPNGLEDRGTSEQTDRKYWSFVGRLSEEKGIRELLANWPPSQQLVVVGEGPLRKELPESANIRFVGALDQRGVEDVLKHSIGVIFSSRWFETGGPPLVVGEAMMQGTPVIARDGNSGADFVAASRAGKVYRDEREIPEILHQVRQEFAALAASSRTAFERNLSLTVWLRSLTEVYQTLRE